MNIFSPVFVNLFFSGKKILFFLELLHPIHSSWRRYSNISSILFSCPPHRWLSSMQSWPARSISINNTILQAGNGHDIRPPAPSPARRRDGVPSLLWQPRRWVEDEWVAGWMNGRVKVMEGGEWSRCCSRITVTHDRQSAIQKKPRPMFFFLPEPERFWLIPNSEQESRASLPTKMGVKMDL